MAAGGLMMALTDLPTATAVQSLIMIISLWGPILAKFEVWRGPVPPLAAGRYSVACDMNRRLEFLQQLNRFAYE
jgi:hypothetical protein